MNTHYVAATRAAEVVTSPMPYSSTTAPAGATSGFRYSSLS